MAVTRDILARLEQDGDVASRLGAVGEIGADFAGGDLTGAERTEALAIFRTLLDDVEETVRAEMARALCGASDLPRDIALVLANDALSIALPILEWSDVLTENDLIEIIRRPHRADGAGEAEEVGDADVRRLVIAGRAEVSEPVVEALVEEGGAPVTLRALANRGARFAEAAIHRVIDRFGADDAVQEALVDRPALPVSVIERLVFMVTTALRTRLNDRHNLSPHTLSGLANQVTEAAALALIGDGDGHSRCKSLAIGLGRRNRLSATLLLRALCLGEFTFVEAALAHLANLTVEGVETRLRYGSTLDFAQIYRRSGLPEAIEQPFQNAVREAYRLLASEAIESQKALCKRLVETLTPFVAVGNLAPAGVRLGAADLDFVLAQIGRGHGPSAASAR